MELSDTIPQLFYHSLPEDEQEYGVFVERNLRSMANLAEDFQAAIELSHWANRGSEEHRQSPIDHRRLKAWAKIGTRAGAMLIYGFYESSQGLNASLVKCPSLLPHYNRKALGNAWKAFHTYFPDYAEIRLAAAHPGEMFTSKKKSAIHSVTDGIEIPGIMTVPAGGSISLEECMVNDHFSCTVNGKLVSYSVSEESMNNLYKVCCAVISALKPAFLYTATLSRSQS